MRRICGLAVHPSRFTAAFCGQGLPRAGRPSRPTPADQIGRPVRSLLALLLLTLAVPADAAPFEPTLVWQTLETEHFRVTYHMPRTFTHGKRAGETGSGSDETQLAQEMAIDAEVAYAKLVPEIRHTPRGKIDIVLVDWTDSANGYASVLPQNHIVIFVTAPEADSSLGLYRDWNEAIITHELTHILHIDTVEGLPAVAKLLLGRIVSTHQLSPGWITEGYATYQETKHTTGGRGRSALVDMVKRAAVIEDRFPPLGNLEGYQAKPPGGNLRYLFGEDFVQFAAERAAKPPPEGLGKVDAWSDWVHRYGRSIPFLLPSKKTFGATFTKMYFEWKEALRIRYAAQTAAVEAAGVTPFTVLSPKDNGCGVPAWSPDGLTLAYSCSDPHRGSTFWLVDQDGANPRKVLKNKFARSLSWRPDSKGFVFSMAHTVQLYNSYVDAYLYDIGADSLKALTTGKRAHDPVFSPDGERLLVVTNGAQDNALTYVTIDGELRPLVPDDDRHTQFGTPRYSPDGSHIAVSVWQDGQRDLWIYDAEGNPLERLTDDVAIDRDPDWSPDGRFLYFSSDRSGIPNIYAVDTLGRGIFQVTNVLTGAYGPSAHPDGKRLAMNVFTTMGSQVAVTDLNPDGWWHVDDLPGAMSVRSTRLPPPQVYPTLPVAPQTTVPEVEPLAHADLTPSPYKPWRTLLPPRFWLPSGYLTSTGDSLGFLGAAATYGQDLLGFIGYSGYLTWRTDAQFLGGGASLTLNRWRPVFSVSFADYIASSSSLYATTPEPEGGGGYLPSIAKTGDRYWDQRVRAAAAMGYPLSSHASFSAYWSGSLRTNRDPIPGDAYLPALPTRGFFSSAGVGWKYSKGQSYARSISPEAARSLAIGAELTPAFFGSYTFDDTGAAVPFTQAQATAEWREYVTNPLIPNQVFAWKLSTGATLGDTFRYGSYRLGGSFSENGITVVPGEWRMLRGYYPASDSGEWYWLGSLEARFPIVHIDRGLGTLPFFVRYLSGAIYVDSGNAFNDFSDPAELGQVLLGTGAEVQLYALAGYGGGYIVRAGYAFAPRGDGIPIGDLGGAYLSFGSSF